MKITENQKIAIQKIAKEYDLKLILLFGSFATGKNRKDSDMDIAILANNKNIFKSLFDYGSLISNFRKIFKKEIDISILNNANPLLLHEANRQSILLYGKYSDFIKFKLYAFHRFNDYKPYFELEAKTNKKAIESYVNK